MDYIITDAGIRFLEELNLKEPIDRKFPKIRSGLLGLWYEDNYMSYTRQHRTHPQMIPRLLDEDERGLADDDWTKIHSFRIPNELIKMGAIPPNLPDETMSAIGAYFLTEERIQILGHEESYRNSRFLTIIRGDTHGDFFLNQYNHVPNERQRTLWPLPTLVKKLLPQDCGGMYGHFDYWTEFLSQLLFYCCQTGQEVPFRNSFERVFYNGKIPSEKSGTVAEYQIQMLKNYGKYGDKPCLPILGRWNEQIDNGWLPTEGSIEEYHGFIDGEKLVYYSKGNAQLPGEREFEFVANPWHGPHVTITPDMTAPLIEKTTRLIINNAGRNAPQDPGLIFRYFPYSAFKEYQQPSAST